MDPNAKNMDSKQKLNMELAFKQKQIITKHLLMGDKYFKVHRSGLTSDLEKDHMTISSRA